MNQDGSKLNTFASNPIWNHKDSSFSALNPIPHENKSVNCTHKNPDERIEHMINNTVKEYEDSGKPGVLN